MLNDWMGVSFHEAQKRSTPLNKRRASSKYSKQWHNLERYHVIHTHELSCYVSQGTQNTEHIKPTQLIYISDIHGAVHRNNIPIVKPTRCTSVSTLFYFGMTVYTFQMVFPSIITSSRLYIQQLYVTDTSKQTAVSVWQMPVAVRTVLNSWFWTERPSETCRVSFQNKMNLIHCVSSWFYYRTNIGTIYIRNT
jgi:hypothetical protein